MSVCHAPGRWSFVLLAGALLLTAAVAHAEDSAGGPRIEFDTTAWDFKQIDHKAPCEHVFKLRNTGKSTLVIQSAHASCGCTVPTLKRMEIPAGETEDLKVTYDSNRIGHFDKSVFVASNDSLHPNMTLRITGTVVSEVIASPAYGVRWLAQVSRDTVEKSSQRLTLSTAQLSELKISAIESSDPHITWKISDGPDRRTKYVDLGLKKDIPSGPINSIVNIHTNSTKEPVTEVRIYADVVGDVQVSPSALYFHNRVDGQVQQETITVKDGKALGGLKIVDVKDDSGRLEFTIEPVHPGSEFAITAKLKPTADVGGNGSGRILITTNRAGDESLAVNYSGLVRSKPR